MEKNRLFEPYTNGTLLGEMNSMPSIDSLTRLIYQGGFLGKNSWSHVSTPWGSTRTPTSPVPPVDQKLHYQDAIGWQSSTFIVYGLGFPPKNVIILVVTASRMGVVPISLDLLDM